MDRKILAVERDMDVYNRQKELWEYEGFKLSNAQTMQEDVKMLAETQYI